MIDTGRPFDIEAAKKTMPWRVHVLRGGVFKMIDRNNKEVDLVTMGNFLEYTTTKIAQAAQK